MLKVPGILFEEFVFWAPDASGSRFSSLLVACRRHFETSINPGLGPWIFIFVWIPKKSFFYCKVNQKSINPGLGLWIAFFFWIRVEKSIRNQSIQAWASGSFCLFGFEGKVNQKPINPGLGLWISRGQRRKVAGPATLPRSLLYLFRRCILSAENLRPLASNFKLETSTS